MLLLCGPEETGKREERKGKDKKILFAFCNQLQFAIFLSSIASIICNTILPTIALDDPLGEALETHKSA